MISAALAMVMFPVSSSIWKIFPSFPDDEKQENTISNTHQYINTSSRRSIYMQHILTIQTVSITLGCKFIRYTEVKLNTTNGGECVVTKYIPIRI